MSKEIWKLIKLLNEYNEAEILDEETLEVNWKYHDIEYLYTKKFWFIQWLVENDKIWDNKNSDRYTMMKLMRAEINEWTEVFEWTERYEFVIMILSIQDEPIKFLISILKNV